MRFLVSRRWVLFALVVVVMAYGAWLLGQWQFHRLHDRKHDNRVTSTNLRAVPVPLDEVMRPGRDVRADDEWRRVTIHGTWDDRHSVVLKYQTRDTQPGVDVVTPLRTGNGTAVLVDRGWLSTTNSGDTRPRLPAPSTGEVTVTGWVRRDATGGSTTVSQLATRAVSSRTIGQVLPYRVYGGFVDLADEAPTPRHALQPTELPDDTSNGPHFFYGLQWWFFGLLAVGGFCYLAWDERRRVREERAAAKTDPSAGKPDPSAGKGDPSAGVGVSEGAEHAAVDRQHHAGHEA